MQRLFLDANVLLEILLVRPQEPGIVRFLAGRDRRHYISALTVHLCYHYCPRQGVPPELLAEFLQNFDILPLDHSAVRLAQRRFDGRDFEDCLQAAAAELGGCDEILTLDKNFCRHSGTKLPVSLPG